MVARTGRAYSAPKPTRPLDRRKRHSRIVNREDHHDTGWSGNEWMRQQGFSTLPTNDQEFIRSSNMDSSMRKYEPLVRSTIDVSQKTKKDYLWKMYKWWMHQVEYTTVFNAIREILSQTFRRMVTRGESWIDTYVPKATGQLRKSMKKQLHAPTNLAPDGTKLDLRIGSHVNYLPYVAEAEPTKARLKHTPPDTRRVNYPGRKDRWRDVVLDDPQAKHYFFMAFIIFMRKVIREELARSIMNVSNRLNVPQYWFRETMRTEDVA